jgi:ADP-ribose pyrophosphatase YjhB (NUDIX family)
MSEYTDMQVCKVKDLFCYEYGYQTPKIDVRAAIIENNQILLVKEQIDGKWSLPGGWAEVDLSLSENIRKEVREEAGLDVEVNKLIAVLDAGKSSPTLIPYGIYKIMTVCKRLSGSFTANIETSDSRFFGLDDLPELSPGRTTRDQVELCFSAVQDDKFIPLFD